MQISNSQTVPASPERTWAALNDAEVLKQCIPGCERIEKISDAEYRVTMQAKIGPVSARFSGKMMLSELNPPLSYTVGFEGQGGAVGFGKGAAKVSLRPEGDGTLLSYVVTAQVGGKLAQIGSRLIDGAALKLADDFFARFVRQFAVPAAASETAPANPGTIRAPRRYGRWILYALGVCVLIALVVLMR